MTAHHHLIKIIFVISHKLCNVMQVLAPMEGATGQSGSSGKSGMHKVYSALALPCLALETQST